MVRPIGKLPLFLAAFLVIAPGGAQPNSPLAFDVASIKPDNSGGNFIEITNGTINGHSATLATCIMWAYGVQQGQISGDGESKQSASSKLARRWRWTTMSQFAGNLGEAMQAPVQDQTGLLGKYDFSLDLTPYLPATGERPDIAGMMVTAVHEQLGLKLESRRAATGVLFIVLLDKQTPN